MSEEPAVAREDAAPTIDTTVAHSPRIWNYWLGGKDNYEVDRQVGDAFVQLFPPIVDIARASRDFLRRGVRLLVGEEGVRQFLDIGTGLPTHDNTHEVAQRAAPDARIVYVDNDPLVLAHARALLTSSPQGRTTYLDADLYDVDQIVAEAGGTLDFEQPIALILMNILGHVPTLELAKTVVKDLASRLPSGSYLVVADGTNVIDGPAFDAAIEMWNNAGSLPYHLRKPAEIEQLFEGFELFEPGVVSCSLWRPQGDIGTPVAVDEFGGIGRKP